MGPIPYYFETALVLAIMFSVLVAAHEFGHYLFARLFNMGVEEFAIGFGRKPLFQWMRRTYYIPINEGEVAGIEQRPNGPIDLEGGGSRAPEDLVELDTPTGKVLRETTRFTVRPWPIGGFVRIKGMMPEEDGSEVTIAGGFYNKPPIQRLIVLFAGPLFSVLAGILILVPLYMTTGFERYDNAPILGAPAPDGPAATAGLKENDVVKEINGKTIHTFYDINSIVRDSAGKKLTFEIERAGKVLDIDVTPVLGDQADPVLGPDLSPTDKTRKQGKLKTTIRREVVKVGFGQAVAKAVSAPIEGIAGLFNMVRHPATIKDSVGGTISITVVTYETVKHGIARILELAAVLSISVGIMNLLPVVPLDGGQMVISFAELFRGGKRVSLKVQNLATLCGMALIGVLVISVCFLDVSRLLDRGAPVKDQPPKKANK